MVRTFEEDGLSFDYPADWQLDREESKDGWVVTLQSPGTAFAVIRLDRSMPDSEEVIQTAFAALQADYPALEASAGIEMKGGEMVMGHDIEFFSLDMLNSCFTRCFYGPAGTVLVLAQSSDADGVDYEPTLRAIWTSMRTDA